MIFISSKIIIFVLITIYRIFIIYFYISNRIILSIIRTRETDNRHVFKIISDGCRFNHFLFLLERGTRLRCFVERVRITARLNKIPFINQYFELVVIS